VLVFGDDRCPISIDLGNTERQIDEHIQGVFVEAGEASTCHITRALD
jgi:hypothetical protein